MAGAVIPPAASEPENDAPAALLMVAGGAGRGGPSSSAAKRRGSSAKKSGVKRPPLNLAGALRIPPVLGKLSPAEETKDCLQPKPDSGVPCCAPQARLSCST